MSRHSPAPLRGVWLPASPAVNDRIARLVRRGAVDLAPGPMIASLRGRILARRELLPQSQGDRERLEHERAIAEYETQIAAIERGGVLS
jgi:hypothetical protein